MEENFMELSEIHWENMFYPYICTHSSSLVNVSPMRIALVYVFLYYMQLKTLYTLL